MINVKITNKDEKVLFDENGTAAITFLIRGRNIQASFNGDTTLESIKELKKKGGKFLNDFLTNVQNNFKKEQERLKVEEEVKKTMLKDNKE